VNMRRGMWTSPAQWRLNSATDALARELWRVMVTPGHV
jgi:hypothetical protein